MFLLPENYVKNERNRYNSTADPNNNPPMAETIEIAKMYFILNLTFICKIFFSKLDINTLIHNERLHQIMDDLIIFDYVRENFLCWNYKFQAHLSWGPGFLNLT